MKNALLNIVMVVFAVCCCMSCVYDYYPEEVADENHVTLAFSMRLLGYGATRAGDGVLPAESVRSLRVVLVDLGLNSEGVREAEPFVEYNEVLKNITLGSSDDGGEGIVRLQFPKIHADRQKKIYLLINCEQDYLDLKANGVKINPGQDGMYLPGNRNAPLIEDATFVSPTGSYSNNDLTEELLVPMTAFHSFSVPSIAELEKDYYLSANLVYTLPDELYVVRAINKITFDFVNATANGGNEGIELLIKDWSISQINTGASYLFARTGTNGNLFAGTDVKNTNDPWMQWLRDEAERSQSPTYDPRWLTEYSMPNGADYGEYRFKPENGGYILAAPAQNGATVSFDTESDPVYFAESRFAVDGQPQQYELAFTVMQKDGGKWGNEYTYRATSSLDASPDDANYFNLQSLFRSTHVKVKVTFSSGLGHPDFEIDVHPYGGYELEPEFGL